jgi:hypothetical protein
MSATSPSPASTMPFGKYKGTPLGELPRAYVDWFGDKLDEWREPFRSALAAEIARRRGAPADAANRVSAPLRQPARPRAPEPGGRQKCDICGLPQTVDRPLVHADCGRDEAPF